MVRPAARTAPRLAAALALVVAAGLVAGGASAQPWHYVLGVPRPVQQVNLCADLDEALEVAHVFEKYGARPGYSVLSSAPTCGLTVVSVTPREVVRRIVISAGKEDEYAVHFVRVETAAGEERWLVTTRDVLGPDG